MWLWSASMHSRQRLGMLMSRRMVSWGISTWIKASMRSWTVCSIVRASQWHQCLQTPGTDYTLWPHEAGDCPAPVGKQGPLHQRKVWQSLTPVPNSSQGSVGYDMEVFATLQGYASCDFHWPTTKLVMLDNVTGSIMITMASPNSFKSVKCAQCEPAIICEANGEPVVDLPILVISSECQSSCTVPGCEHRSH